MTVDTQNTPPGLQAYLNRIGEPEHPVLQALRGRTQNHRLGKMALAREQAALLTWLARLIRAERYLEVGVFTGYSSTAMALALPEHARITACDISVTFTDIARETWRQAGVEHKIELHLQPALLTLDGLIAQGLENTYDMTRQTAHAAVLRTLPATGAQRRHHRHRQRPFRRPRHGRSWPRPAAKHRRLTGFQPPFAARQADCPHHPARRRRADPFIKKIDGYRPYEYQNKYCIAFSRFRLERMYRRFKRGRIFVPQRRPLPCFERTDPNRPTRHPGRPPRTQRQPAANPHPPA